MVGGRRRDASREIAMDDADAKDEALLMQPIDPPSRCVIDEAGDVLRRHRSGEPVDQARLTSAFELLALFRRSWEGDASPTLAVAEELRRLASRLVGRDSEVSERIKREDRIIDKLVRLPSLPLSLIQDIGGCRVVVPTLRDAAALRSAIRYRWTSSVRREYDYVVRPKSDGYRAVHVVVEERSCAIEIQLRTRLQHAWARTVERLEYRSKAALRAGAGDPALQLALRTLSDVLAESEPDMRDSEDRVSDALACASAASRAAIVQAMAVVEAAW
jgi:ppGpp synthetase/RelA/SpoT-type nucleotidyltranferase